MMSYDEVLGALTPESEDLFCRMVEMHLAAEGVAGTTRMFLLASTISGTFLTFTAGESFAVDESALNDLESHGLVRIAKYGSKGTPNYDIPGPSVKFYRWLRDKRGEVIEEVEVRAATLVDGEGFARRFPGVAAAFREARGLLNSDGLTDDQAAEVGNHLRGALMDLVKELTPDSDRSPERALDRLDEMLDRSSIATEEAAAVRALARSAWRMAQRLTHARENRQHGVPVDAYREVRRAIFLSMATAYEIVESMSDSAPR